MAKLDNCINKLFPSISLLNLGMEVKVHYNDDQGLDLEEKSLEKCFFGQICLDIVIKNVMYSVQIISLLLDKAKFRKFRFEFVITSEI